MRNREGPDLAGIDIYQCGQWYDSPRDRRFHVKAIERRQVALQLRRDFKNDRARIELCIVLRHLPLAVGVVERVVDQLG